MKDKCNAEKVREDNLKKLHQDVWSKYVRPFEEELRKLPFKRAYKLAEYYNKAYFYNQKVFVVSHSYGLAKPFINVDIVKTVTLQHYNYLKSKEESPMPPGGKIPTLEQYEEEMMRRKEENGISDEAFMKSILKDNREPEGTDKAVLEAVRGEFNYTSMLAKKRRYLRDLYNQREILKNKKVSKEKSKEHLHQIEYFNSTIRKLRADIKILSKPEVEFAVYIDSFKNDLNNIERLLNKPTLENLEAARKYLEVLDLVTSSEKGGFLYDTLDSIKESKEDKYKDLVKINKEVSVLRKKLEDDMVEITKESIKHHLEHVFKDKKWSEKKLRQEAERLYNNQFKDDDIGWVHAKVMALDDQEEENVILSTIYKMYADAIAKNNNKDAREQLFNVKENVEKELIKQGYSTGKGWRSKASWSPFIQNSPIGYKLIGKFSNAWLKFKNNFKKDWYKYNDLVYQGNKSDTDIKNIKKYFDKLKEDVNFLDITKVPEILENKDFQEFRHFFSSNEDAEAYKKKIIATISEREYKKLVDEQIDELYQYQIFMEAKQARIIEKHKLKGENLQKELTDIDKEKVFNNLLRLAATKNPFVFSHAHNVTGDNLVSRYSFTKGKRYINNDTYHDLEYVSMFPKKGEYYDSNFDIIENNKVFIKAWSMMANLVEYNNKNGFLRKPNNLNEYSIGSQQKRLSTMPEKLLGTFSKDFFRIMRNNLDILYKGLTTSQYKESTDVAGQRYTVDQEVEKRFKILNTGLEHLTKKEQAALKAKITEDVLAEQEENLIDNILASTEITEKFKAQREVLLKMEFLQRVLNKSDKKNIKEILQSFMNSKVYGINNRANWNNPVKGKSKGYWSIFPKYNPRHERVFRKQVKSLIKKYREELEKDPKNAKVYKKEIKALEKYLDSNGEVITSGSVLEAFTLKLQAWKSFSLNIPAQMTNKMIGDINAVEVDGREGFWDAGTIWEAFSFVKKHKKYVGFSNTKRELETGEALLQRLELFQNSTNEIFKLQKSRALSTAGIILEDPRKTVDITEKTIQRPQIYALMSKIFVKGIVDDKEVERPMWNPKTRTFEAFEVIDGRLKLKKGFDSEENINTYIKNTSQEYADLFGDGGHVPKQIAFINGNYMDTSHYLYSDYTYSAILGMFKRWGILTVKKKLGIYTRLAENDNLGVAIGGIAAKSALYTAATGAIYFTPVMFLALTAYTVNKGYKAAKIRAVDDLNRMDFVVGEIKKLKALHKVGGRHAMLGIATVAESLSFFTNFITGKPLINSDLLKKIYTYNKERSTGGVLTEDEEIQVKEDIYFLATQAAFTLAFIAMRFAVLSGLAPDDEDEEEYQKLVDRGWSFWERATKYPTVMLYYIAENMLSGFIDDNSVLLDYDNMNRQGDASIISGLTKTLKDLGRRNPTLSTGENKGNNAFWTHLSDKFTPAYLKDWGSLGFGERSQSDYEPLDPISSLHYSKLKWINEERRMAYSKYVQDRLDNEGYVMEKEIRKAARKKFPVIKDYMINPDNTLNQAYSHLWKDYYTED